MRSNGKEKNPLKVKSGTVSRQVRLCCIFNHPSLPVCPSTSPFSHPFVVCVDACRGGRRMGGGGYLQAGCDAAATASLSPPAPLSFQFCK